MANTTMDITQLVTGTIGIDLTTDGHGDDHHNDSSHEHGVHVVLFDFEHVAHPAVVVMFILVAMLLKLGFHYAAFLSSILPESCLLVITGAIFGGILRGAGSENMFRLEPETFFLFLLPPIVLDSAYSLHDRVFMDNLGSILVHAVIGTVLNFILIGPTLYGLAAAGAMGSLNIDFVQCLLFASFIVAVDPVAVLAVFQEIGVNNGLYFMVFGESLLNDGVTVVLSNMMKEFVEFETIPVTQILLGIASFFTISLGGLMIGITFGVLTALVTKITGHVRIVEPIAVITLGYASYLAAEMFHWSGIISTIGCGLVQAEYAFDNVSRKSRITIDYAIRMISIISDAIIFLFLGIELVDTDHVWNAGFILFTLLFCLVYRCIVSFALNFLLNKGSTTEKLNYEEQFIMWYGGLRGAVCFALCSTISDTFPHKQMFLTTTLIVILFTVFIQGSTIKPLVSLCKIKLKDESETVSMFEELNTKVIDHLMTGIEVVTHYKGENYLRTWATYLNETYFQRWLQKDPFTADEKLVADYANLLLSDYEDTIKNTYFKKGEEKSRFYTTPSPVPSPPSDRRRLPEADIKRTSNQSKYRRRTLTDVILRRRTLNLENPEVDDLKHILNTHDRREKKRYQKCDKNLLHDDLRDIEHCLREKHLKSVHLRRQGVVSMNQGSTRLDHMEGGTSIRRSRGKGTIPESNELHDMSHINDGYKTDKTDENVI